MQHARKSTPDAEWLKHTGGAEREETGVDSHMLPVTRRYYKACDRRAVSHTTNLPPVVQSTE